MGGRNRDREDSLNPSSLCGSLVFPDECAQNIRRAGREKESHKVTKKGEKNKAATTTGSKTEWRDIDWCVSTLPDSLIKPINLYAEKVSNVNRPNQAGQNGFVRKLWKQL